MDTYIKDINLKILDKNKEYNWTLNDHIFVSINDIIKTFKEIHDEFITYISLNILTSPYRKEENIIIHLNGIKIIHSIHYNNLLEEFNNIKLYCDTWDDIILEKETITDSYLCHYVCENKVEIHKLKKEIEKLHKSIMDLTNKINGNQ